MPNWNRVNHFNRDEFGHADGIDPAPNLVYMLDQARSLAGIPFAINSGIRTPERNAAVGGAPESAHLGGYAVDIAANTSRERFVILRALLHVGFTRIGIGRSFIHADVDPDKAPEVAWLY